MVDLPAPESPVNHRIAGFCPAMAARAEGVMLNKGPNVYAAVELLDRLLRRMAEHQVKKTPTLRALHAWERRAPAPAAAG